MHKVLIVANTDWYLYNFRLSLAQHINNSEYDVVLVSPHGKFSPHFNKHGLKWIAWKLGRKSIAPWKEFLSFLDILKIYKQENPDIVHHHTIKPTLYGTIAARLCNVPSVINSITGLGYIFSQDSRKAHLLRPLVSAIFKFASRHPNSNWIFENNNDREYLTKNNLIPNQNTYLIEGVGVDIIRFSPQPEPEGVPIILFAGRMLWDKGVGVLVEAVRKLANTIPFKAVLVGEPDEGNPTSVDISTIKSWEEEGIIEWWGWHHDMQDIYNQANIITLPSMYKEGLPTVLLEAAACGKPLVATSIPGSTSIVKHGINGFLIPVNDPGALANALKELLESPALRDGSGWKTISRR
jgi:glycosyltransferase involved in cell wall biosynthesis